MFFFGIGPSWLVSRLVEITLYHPALGPSPCVGSPRQRQEALHRRLTKLEEKAKASGIVLWAREKIYDIIYIYTYIYIYIYIYI